MADINVGSANLFTRMDVAKGVYGESVYVWIVAVIYVGRAGVVETRSLMLVNMAVRVHKI